MAKKSKNLTFWGQILNPEGSTCIGPVRWHLCAQLTGIFNKMTDLGSNFENSLKKGVKIPLVHIEKLVKISKFATLFRNFSGFFSVRFSLLYYNILYYIGFWSKIYAQQTEIWAVLTHLVQL